MQIELTVIEPKAIHHSGNLNPGDMVTMANPSGDVPITLVYKGIFRGVAILEMTVNPKAK